MVPLGHGDTDAFRAGAPPRTGALMKRIATSLVLALSLLAGAAQSQQPGDGRVGTAAAVRGSVQLAALGPAPTALVRQVGSVVASGAPLFLGDAIESGPGAGLQILLADETVFTIGPDAKLTIDEFVYNPGGGAGPSAASATLPLIMPNAPRATVAVRRPARSA